MAKAKKAKAKKMKAKKAGFPKVAAKKAKKAGKPPAKTSVADDIDPIPGGDPFKLGH